VSHSHQPVEHSVQFLSSARYYSLGPENAAQVWICLHGYGQLGRFFIRKFESISQNARIIVPEGLHRFYLEGNEGRVGASWMTKEDRLRDIRNQNTYLDTVLKEVSTGSRVEEIVVFGFSQGAATAGRWVETLQNKPKALVCWCGMFPHDVDISTHSNSWNSMELYEVMGHDDPYRSDSRYTSWLERASTAGVDVQSIEFQGGHEILSQALESLRDRIGS
jgi:predicted esterase